MVKQKLTSRKFWVALSSILSGVLMMFGYGETSVEVICGAVLTFGGAIGYMVAEGIVDAKRIGEAVEAISDVVEEVKK